MNLMKVEATRFKLDTDKDNIYFLAWTTTPWTLPGNVALGSRGLKYIHPS